MKEKYKKYIGNKAFYMMVMAIAVPIMIQNGLTNFVNLLDNIMVGRLGTEEMSGVSIVNQIIFVYNLCIFGGTAGVGIFTAQYFGQKNDEGIRSTFRYKIWLAIRRTAIENNVTMFTSLDTVKVLLDVLEEITIGVSPLYA